MTLMPGENSDYDYSALSCTSDASFNHRFFPESETLKGVFYQRARLIHPQEDLLKGFHPDDRKRHIIINVGGIKYLLPWTTLDEFPLTRFSGNIYLDKVGLVLRILRALRILYVMRLARHSLGLQTLGLTARRCTREFGLLLLFLCVAIALFAPLLYVIENEMADSQEFTSIPACYWWAVITMTTVGYGDMVPRSIPGQVVALSSILSGILLMAFPVTSIFHTFSRSYLELKQEQERIMYRRAQFLLKAKSQMSNESQGSEVLFTTLSSETRDNE
ncbi:LOW QUALITY PROTEIN: potassium voltage-gated channel subfamily G member 1 [Cinclus cinclus]|uniref:LOW QUALITY PROTEIN: potassium voltage-gated channel subfamily G member 1 n=1 Tax=Cinclus cinclus TaxID=127875 RepID=UPI002E12FAE6